MRTATIGRIAAVLAAAAAATLAALTAMSAPASATNCQTKTYWNAGDVVTAGGGTATVTADGLVLTTPDIPSKATWKVTLGSPITLSDVTDLSYITRKTDADEGDNNDAAIASYDLYLDVEGTLTTLVYEPYYQIVGNPPRNSTQSWNVDAGKFWATVTIPGITAEPGGSYAGNKTLAEIKTANPQAKVVGYGSHQGTYNKGTISRINNVKFAAKGTCVTHVWNSTQSPSPSPSKSASTGPSTGASATASSTHTASPSSSATPALPVTGSNTGSMVLVGAGAVAAGAVLMLAVRKRRRRVDFTA